MVKAEQGNMAGVRKNLAKAVVNLERAPERCRGIDTRALAAACALCIRHAQAIGGSFDWRFKPRMNHFPRHRRSSDETSNRQAQMDNRG